MRLLLLFILPCCTLKSQFLWIISADTIVQYNYYRGDEFNNGDINRNMWQIGFPWSRNSFQNDNYILDDNFSFENGKAHFIVRKKDSLIKLSDYEMTPQQLEKNKISPVDGDKYLFKYSTALLWSKELYQYGYFEIKFKGVSGQGVWPAFWLYGGNPNYEIDFFELKGEKENKLHVDVHCPNGCSNFYKGPFVQHRGWGRWLKLDEKLSKGYNIVSGEWTPNYITWYLNGQLIAYSDQKIETPMSLVVGTGVAKKGGPFAPAPNKRTTFPNAFIVDYVRVFRVDTSRSQYVIDHAKTHQIYNDTNTFADFSVNVKKKSITTVPNALKNRPQIIVSAVQTKSASIDVRVLGATINHPLKISITNQANQVLAQYTVTSSVEKTISSNGMNVIYMTVETAEQKKTQKLNITESK